MGNSIDPPSEILIGCISSYDLWVTFIASFYTAVFQANINGDPTPKIGNASNPEAPRYWGSLETLSMTHPH